jgi:hypothetical protein
MGVRVRSAIEVMGIVAATLAIAACSGGGTRSNSAPFATTTPSTQLAPAAAVNAVQVIPGTANGTSPCEKAAPTPASPGELGSGSGGNAAVSNASAVAAEEHGVRGRVVQLPLTHAEQATLDGQLAQAAAVARRYPTVATALAAGYAQSTPYVPCIGAHYTKVTLADTFDPAHPSELLYDGTQPNSKIVGLSYLVYNPGGLPPDGFAGPNDHWHQHNANGGLCLRGEFVVGSEATTRAQCAALGGQKTLLTDIWMLHAWIVPGLACTWGVFSGECPALGGRTCGNAYDAPDPSITLQCAAAIRGA